MLTGKCTKNTTRWPFFLGGGRLSAAGITQKKSEIRPELSMKMTTQEQKGTASLVKKKIKW